ncbi:hypothetical protein KIT04_004 [Vibrio phage KIT04]|nr:hypothetical protein KIT04_004 [Vibrio phage KIT04]
MNLLYNKNLYLYNKMIFDNQDFVVLVLFTKVHKYAEKYPKVHKLFGNTIARVKAKIA